MGLETDLNWSFIVFAKAFMHKKGGEQPGLVEAGACMINPLQPPHNEKFIKKIGLIK